ncbi:MAG: hypothetical protein NT027_03295, partial [Proteobacteria bacterium]|nr:hypothetical protein [Pseudomonadota bacterium]
MRKLNNLTLGLSFLIVSACVFAESTTKKITKKATVAVTMDSNKGQKTRQLTFTTQPGEGLKINADGPWKLEIKTPKGFVFDVSELKRDQWQEATSGFQTVAKVEPGIKEGGFSYKMTTFVCTT